MSCMSHLHDNLRFVPTVHYLCPQSAAPLWLAVFPSVLRRSMCKYRTAGSFWLRTVSGIVSGLWERLVVLLLVCAKKVAAIYSEVYVLRPLTWNFHFGPTITQPQGILLSTDITVCRGLSINFFYYYSILVRFVSNARREIRSMTRWVVHTCWILNDALIVYAASRANI